MKNLLYFLPFFFLFSCSDPCDDIQCRNGGACIDGVCDCPPGFGDDDCNRELIPQSVTIEEIMITKLPARKPDGSAWDNLSSGPDLFAIVRIGGQAVAISAIVSNGTTGARLLGGSFPYTRTGNFGEDIRVEIWDDDGNNTADFVGGYLFADFFAIGAGFPEFRKGGGAADALNIELRYTYRH